MGVRVMDGAGVIDDVGKVGVREVMLFVEVWLCLRERWNVVFHGL